MLNNDGSFSFTEEVMALVDAFLVEYEGTKGALSSDLERGLVVSYVLGAMLCDLELVWEALGSAPVFGRQDPRAIYEECVRRNADRSEARREVAEELARRGWIAAREEQDAPELSDDGPAEA